MKKILTMVIAGASLAGAIAVPAVSASTEAKDTTLHTANANVKFKNDAKYGNYNVVVKDGRGYRLVLHPGESEYIYYAPRKVWIPAGCQMQKDGKYFADAWGREGRYKTVKFQFTTANFSVADCGR